MRGGRRENQGTFLSKVENCKWLLRNKKNIGNIGKAKTKEKKERGESKDSSQQGKIFRFLLRNRIKETDVDGFETKVLRQHYARLGGPKGLPPLKSPKQVHSIHSSAEELKKPKDKNYKQKSDLKPARAIGRLIFVMTKGTGLNLSLGTQSLLHTKG